MYMEVATIVEHLVARLHQTQELLLTISHFIIKFYQFVHILCIIQERSCGERHVSVLSQYIEMSIHGISQQLLPT